METLKNKSRNVVWLLSQRYIEWPARYKQQARSSGVIAHPPKLIKAFNKGRSALVIVPPAMSFQNDKYQLYVRSDHQPEKV